MDKNEKSDFRINRETFSAAKILLDKNFEHSVEKDFVLPDYYPDIFRVLKCFVTPVVNSQGINGNKLSYEGTALIRVIYVSENSSAVNCIEAKAPFSKSAELTGVCQNPYVTVLPKCDYVNCRVVNQRRLDIRSAVTAAVKVVGEEISNAVTDAYGEGIQLKKSLFSLPVKRITAAKRITLVEELELTESKPPLRNVIKCGCKVSGTEEKIIAGKLVTKGEAEISVLYSCADKDGVQGAQTMKFSVPFSQIIDMEGIDESFSANVEVTAADCQVVTKGESGRNLECELTLLVNCLGIKYSDVEIVTDAYSTKWECTLEKKEKEISEKSVDINKECSVSCTADCCENGIKEIFDCFGEIKDVFCKYNEDEKHFSVSGNITFGIFGKDENDIPFYCENDCAFDENIPLPEMPDFEKNKSPNKDKELIFVPKTKLNNNSYRISGENALEMKFDFSIFGEIDKSLPRNIIENISICTDKPKKQQSGYALKLCRINGKEDIWDIAKKYSTSVKAIMEENELDDDKQAAEGMLLIPLMK